MSGHKNRQLLHTSNFLDAFFTFSLLPLYFNLTIMYKYLFILSVTFALAACSGSAPEADSDNSATVAAHDDHAGHDHSHDHHGHDHSHDHSHDHHGHDHGAAKAVFTKQVVEASCGQCKFGMDGKKGCDLAVRIDGKGYFVDGTAIDDHGDAHGPHGFCSVIRKAEVSGEIKDGKFMASAFDLIPVEEK